MSKNSTSLNYIIAFFLLVFSSTYSTVNSQTVSFSKTKDSNTNIAPSNIYIESDFTGTAPGINIPWNAVRTLNDNISLIEGWTYPKFISANGGSGVMGANDINNAFGFSIDAGNVVKSTLEVAIASNEYISLKIAIKSGTINLNRAEVQFAVNRISGFSATKYAVFTSLKPFTAGNELFTGSISSYNVNTTFVNYFPATGYENVSGTIEIRIYMYDAFYYGHKTSLTAFCLKDGDREAPTTPTDFTAISKNSYSIDLFWSPSADNVGIVGYDVYRDTLLLGTTTSTHFVTGIYNANTTYNNFWVQARDAPGNLSGASNKVSISTLPAVAVNDRSPLGMNINAASDYSMEHPFINIAKCSRSWGKSGAPWLTYDGVDGRPALGEMVDAKGYLKPGKGGSTIVVCNGNENFWPATGVEYVCRYEGKGKMQLERDWRVISVTDGRAVFYIPAGCTDMFKINIIENDLVDPIHNIWISELKYESYYDDQTNPEKMFYPAFVDNWKMFKVFRTMEATVANNSLITSWQNPAESDFSKVTAPTEGDFTWRVKGMPVEVLVKLANYMHIDPWFCIPNQATDNYISGFAKYVSDNLSPNLHCYIEYSNECWNWMFAQSHYCVSQGSLIWGSADQAAYHKYYALRSVKMFHLFEAAFNNDLSRLVRVFAWQAAGSSVTLLDTEYPAEYSGKAYTHGDALAIGPYFGISLDGYNSPAFNMTVPQILDYCNNYVNTTSTLWIKNNSIVAKNRKLGLICYEGGQHLVANGADKDAVSDSTTLLVSKFAQVNADPRMKDIYLNYFNVWKNNGGGMFCAFNSCALGSKYGHWGAKTYESQPRSEAPKYDAMLTFMEQNDMWFLENTPTIDPIANKTVTKFEEIENESFGGYPTLIHDWLIIQTNADKQLVTIIDLNGKTVFKRQFPGSEININTSGFESGIYIVGLQSEQGVQYKKIIKK